MNTVILGASGFLGKSITNALENVVSNLTLFDMHYTEEQKKKYNCVVGDFSSPSDLEKVLTNKVDTVVHLISTTVPATGDKYPAADVRGNLISTLEFLDLCVKNKIHRVIFASSGGTVYGKIKEPANETDPCNPICSYGIVKKSIEDYLLLYNRMYGLEFLVLRIGNPYGINQSNNKPQGVIGAFLNRTINEQPIEIWGDGNVVRDFIHIDDVAQAFLSVMAYQGSEHIFNIGTGEGHSLNEVIRIIEIISGRSLVLKYRQQNTLDVPMNVLDIKRIENETGWNPKIKLKEGITKVYSELINIKKLV